MRLPEDVLAKIDAHTDGDNRTEKLISLLGGTERISTTESFYNKKVDRLIVEIEKRIMPTIEKEFPTLNDKVKTLSDEMEQVKRDLQNVSFNIGDRINNVYQVNNDNSTNISNSTINVNAPGCNLNETPIVDNYDGPEQVQDFMTKKALVENLGEPKGEEFDAKAFFKNDGEK